MLCLRRNIEDLEKHTLAPFASRSADASRLRPEPECELRSAYQRDRDRIVHSKAFRRLKHKTQVFLSPTGDHYRTRLTHTLEVSQIARTLARALRLNEDLTEAISLGHDLGHTPFGHAGEEVLSEIYSEGFSHQEQSLRVVDVLEKDGLGLNLTLEVRDGILKHSKGKGTIIESDPEKSPLTIEGQLVRISDIIAYTNHDVDDALRGGVITESDVPPQCLKILGSRTSKRIDTMVRDLVANTKIGESSISLNFSSEVLTAMEELRDFLYNSVYDISRVHLDFRRSAKVIRELYEVFISDDRVYGREIGKLPPSEPERSRTVCDFVAGMTDRYALDLYHRIFLPRPWAVL